MQPAQRNSLLLIAVILVTIWLTGRGADFVTIRDDAVRLPGLPERVGEWTSQPFNFKEDPSFASYAGSRLGGRRYTNPRGESVDLFLVGTARFDQFHTPEFCYITDGFQLTEERTATLAAGGRTIQARRLCATNGRDRQDVVFWFQHGDVTAEHRAVIKLAALTRLLEGKSPQPLILYRFSSPVRGDRSPLDAFIPRILGSLEPGEIARGRGARPQSGPAPL